MNALLVAPPFCEYHFVDLHEGKVAALEEIAADRPNVKVHPGDCNEVLLNEVFPKVRYEDYRRGLCLLDPYGLHLDWEVIRTVGQMRSVEIFLNFPVMDMNMNVLWSDPFRERRPEDVERMNAFWGNESWRQVAYPTTENLFGYPEKASNEVIAEGFRERLQKVAGFEYVPAPLPMRNNNGTVVYYLFFASHKPVAANIVEYIFDKYGATGAR
jgi:three-Cys-motif partner protein